MTEASTDTTEESITDQLQPHIKQSKGLATSLENKLPPTYSREVGHLITDLDVLERWSKDVLDQGVNALAGGPTVVDTAQTRIKYLQKEIGQSDQDTKTILDKLQAELEEVEDIVDGLEISKTAYVVYVNRSFADRYFEAEISVSKLLIAGLDDPDIKENVDDYGLFPMDGLFGNSVEDLAFPANREVNLNKDHRIYWTSTSDGGKIA